MAEPKANETLTVEDLARPLTLDTVMYFAGDHLPKAEGKEYQSTRSGKFVRIGGAMVIGATLDYGKPDYRGDLRFLLHWQLGRFLFEDDERGELAKATRDAEPKIGGGLTDAGSTSIKVNPEGVPTELVLGSSSYDFGRADEAGRAKSVEVAQLLVGDSILVSQRS